MYKQFENYSSPYSAEIEFRSQIQTSKVDPRTVRVFFMAVDP